MILHRRDGFEPIQRIRCLSLRRAGDKIVVKAGDVKFSASSSGLDSLSP